MTIGEATGVSTELEYLLELAERRTPGRIQAKASALQVGSHRIQGFPQAVDAHYLAQAANALPKVVTELIRARQEIRDQAEALQALRREVGVLQDQLTFAREQVQQKQSALQKVKQQLYRLTRQAKDKVKVKVETRIVEEIRYQVVDVPTTWVSPDGHRYQLVYLPSQWEGSYPLEQEPTAQVPAATLDQTITRDGVRAGR